MYADKPNASVAAVQAALSCKRPGRRSACRRLVLYWPQRWRRRQHSGCPLEWPGRKGKLAPGYKIIAVNGQAFSGDRLRAAIHDAKGKSEPIHITFQADTFLSTADIDYHDGERYPALERVEGTPAYLDDITKPVAVSRTGK